MLINSPPTTSCNVLTQSSSPFSMLDCCPLSDSTAPLPLSCTPGRAGQTARVSFPWWQWKLSAQKPRSLPVGTVKLTPAGSHAVFGHARVSASPVSNGLFLPSWCVCGDISPGICPCGRPTSLWGVTGTDTGRHFLLLFFFSQLLRF